MATNKVPSLCKQPDCKKLIFCYGEEFITDLTISTDLGKNIDSDNAFQEFSKKLSNLQDVD